MPHVLRQPDLIRAMSPLSSLRTALARQFSDPRLAQLFGRYATYVGGAPHLRPAILSLIWQAEAAGVWVVEGGMHHLAEAVAALARRKGADIRLGEDVKEICLKGGRVNGVTLSCGAFLEADTVVYAGDPRSLATGRLGAGLKRVASQTASLPRSFSARVYSFAASPYGQDLAHHNVFFDDDPDAEFLDLEAGRIPRDPTLYLCACDRGQGTAPPTTERFRSEESRVGKK